MLVFLSPEMSKREERGKEFVLDCLTSAQLCLFRVGSHVHVGVATFSHACSLIRKKHIEHFRCFYVFNPNLPEND